MSNVLLAAQTIEALGEKQDPPVCDLHVGGPISSMSKSLIEFIPKKYLTKEQFQIEVIGLTLDSQLVQPGFLFFGFPGTAVDGRFF